MYSTFEIAPTMGTKMDGGIWGLVIVASAFFIQVLAFGISASIGVYNIEFLDYFDNDTVGVSLIASLNWAMFLGAGPLASFLLKKFSYRKITLVGSAMVVLGLFLMPFLPYIPAFCLCFGVLTGIGSCLVYVPSHVLCGLYYERHQSLATGIATSGSGLGGAIMPIVLGNIIETYGWKGSLIIVAGMELHLFALSALLRSPPTRKVSETEINSEGSGLLDSEEPRSVAKSREDIQEDLNVSTMQGKGNLKAKLAVPEDSSSVTLGPDGNITNHGEEECEELLQVKDLNGSLNGCVESLELTRRDHLLENTSARDTDAEKAEVKVCSENQYKELRHIYLFTDVGFNVYFFSNILWNAGAAMVMAFAPEHTTKFGISQMNSAWLLTIFGLGDFLGGLLGGVIGNVWPKHRQLQYIMANIICGMCILFFPFGSTFGDFTAILLIAGLAIGVVLGLLVVVLIDIIGTDNLSDGLGYIMLANGFGAFGGPALAGYIHKVTDSFDLAFYMGGILCVVSGASMWLIPVIYYLFPSTRTKPK